MDHARFEKSLKKFFNNLPGDSFTKSSCPFGHSIENSVFLFEKDSMLIHRCECDMVFNARQPNGLTLKLFYTESESMTDWANLKETEAEKSKQARKFNQVIDFLHRRHGQHRMSSEDIIGHINPKNLLDIGCGVGYFLNLLRQKIPTIKGYGIDPNKKAVEIVKSKGIECTESSFDHFLDHNLTSYDVITLFGVLEHVSNPGYLIEKCRENLSKDGYLIICVPNVESKIVSVMHGDCFTFCPQHLNYFSFNTLRRLVSQYGLIEEDSFTIEPESEPLCRWMSMLPPYGDLDEKYKKHLAGIDFIQLDQEILNNNGGYKIMYIAKKIDSWHSQQGQRSEAW